MEGNKSQCKSKVMFCFKKFYPLKVTKGKIVYRFSFSSQQKVSETLSRDLQFSGFTNFYLFDTLKNMSLMKL